MRKRIVTAFFGVAVIGAFVFALSRPKPGTIEWHKKEYFALIDHIYGRRFVDRARQLIESNTGLLKRHNWQQQEQALRLKAEVHRLALVEMGDIAQRWFHVSNDNAVSDALLAATSKKGSTERALITCQVVSGGGVLYVTGPSDDMAFWQNLIREAEAK